MIWTAKTNCALSSRKITESESITTTRLRTERIGWWKTTTPSPPRTARIAATKKTAIATTWAPSPPAGGGSGGGGTLGFESGLDVWRQRLQQPLLGVDELLAARVRELVLRPEHDR